MERFLRVLKKLGNGLMVVIAVLVVALLIARWVFVRQLNAEIAAIKARGEPLTEAEMVGPPIPDSENAALVYEKAFRELPKGDVFWKETEPIRNAIEKGDPASLGESHRMIAKYHKAMTLGKQAVSLPKCRFSANRTMKFLDSPGLRLSHLSRLALIYAALNARSGRMDEAVDNTIASLVMDTVPTGKRDVSSGIMQGVMVWRTCNEIRKIAGYGRINERQARRLYDQLAKVAMVEVHKQNLRGERAHWFAMFRAEQKDPVGWLRKEGVPVSGWDAMKLRLDPLSLAWRHVLSIGDQAARLHLGSKLIGADYNTYSEARSLQLEAESGIPFYAILTKILAPVYARSMKSPFRADAEVKGSQVFLAVLAYHDRHGSNPSSLAELRKGLGWTIPKDPFNGKEFVYKPKDKGFFLYSVGPDLKDNGGRERLSGKAYREDAEYDITWEMKP